MAAQMTAPTLRPATSPLPPPAAVQQLHHYAYRAKDAEETRHFYEDILGLPLHALFLPPAGRLLHRFFRPRQ